MDIKYGSFLTAVINFLIMAFVIFLLVKGINKLAELGIRKDKKQKAEEPAKPVTKICPYCKSEIPADAVKCCHCTSDLEEPVSESNTPPQVTGQQLETP